MTQSLKMEYLWVVALCIVQNDEEDFAIELSKMGNIYQGVTLTISAAKADHSKAGFRR